MLFGPREPHDGAGADTRCGARDQTFEPTLGTFTNLMPTMLLLFHFIDTKCVKWSVVSSHRITCEDNEILLQHFNESGPLSGCVFFTILWIVTRLLMAFRLFYYVSARESYH